MKFTSAFLFIISMIFVVSCGGDSKKSSSSSNMNAYGYKTQTFNAYYTPTKQYMVYYGNQWYSLQPYGSNGQDIQSLQQTTANAIMSGQSQYPIEVRQIGGSYISMFRVRIQGILGAGTTGNIQQVQGQTGSAGSIGVQSISLY